MCTHQMARAANAAGDQQQANELAAFVQPEVAGVSDSEVVVDESEQPRRDRDREGEHARAREVDRRYPGVPSGSPRRGEDNDDPAQRGRTRLRVVGGRAHPHECAGRASGLARIESTGASPRVRSETRTLPIPSNSTSRPHSSSSLATTRSSKGTTRSPMTWVVSWPLPAITTTSPGPPTTRASAIAVADRFGEHRRPGNHSSR